MPNPKRRHSHARGAKRRTHYKLTLPQIETCAKCNSPRLQHVACPKCGFYKDRNVSSLVTTEE